MDTPQKDEPLIPLEVSALGQSTMVTPKPTTRGFGVLRSTKDLFWNEEENLYSDLVSKTFDVNNSSYHRKLNSSVEAFVEKKNSTRLAEVFEICKRDYPKQVKIGDIESRMAHEFLVEENKQKQCNLRKILEEKDKQFIEQQNILLIALQKSFCDQLFNMTKNLSTHLQDRNAEVEKGGTEIRKYKEALLNLHKLNTTFKLPKDGYCSDEEGCEPENVKNFYDDSHILEKIKIDQPMNDTRTKNERILATLHNINVSVQSLTPLRY